MKTTIIGFVMAAYLAFDMSSMMEWNAGSNLMPREIIAKYMAIAYDEGRGADARELFYIATTEDHNPDLPDRQNGEPIQHEIQKVVTEGLTVVVYHRIAKTQDRPAVDAVDFFRVKNGSIVERSRISQPVTANTAPSV